MDLQQTSQHFRILADSTRLRLLMLLDREELSVAELAAITRLAQPRVSTHLAKLKEAGLVCDRREGVFVYYRMAAKIGDPGLRALWELLRAKTADPLVSNDIERIPGVIAARRSKSRWADSVAGDMERHYSPGRTWEATTRAIVHLLQLGDVLDIASGDGVLAELLAPQARSICCLDKSRRVVEAGRKRLRDFSNVAFEPGDMHELPFTDRSFDTVLLLHALTYSNQPELVFAEAARVLRPGGRLLAVTLKQHRHKNLVAQYDHVNLGFTASQLRKFCTASRLSASRIQVSAIEKRSPNFEVLTLFAEKAGRKQRS